MGVGEYDSEGGVDGSGEGCVGAAVAGVEDAPGFQLCDGSFYQVADGVESSYRFLVRCRVVFGRRVS